MPQVTINYKKPETLKVLKSLGKYLGFDVIKHDKANINGVATLSSKEMEDRIKSILVPGDPSIDITQLREVFSGRNIDAKQLRKDAWERKK